MEQCTVEQAMRSAESVRKAIEAYRFSWKDKLFNVGVNIGLVAITELDQNTEKLMMAADTACYAAKRAGRNRTRIFHANDEEFTQEPD